MTTAADWIPADWARITVEGQTMVDALALRDLLVTTSKRPGWAK